MTRLPIPSTLALILLATGVPAQQMQAPPPNDIEALLTRFSDDPDQFTQTEGAADLRPPG